MRARWLGRLDYDTAHAAQLALRDALIAGQGGSELLLLEHEPTITFGRRGPTNDVLVPLADIARRGIAVRSTERGGQATYHGPGQLVGYIVARLRDMAPDVRTYIWRIEETLIRAVGSLGVNAGRCLCGRGVFVGDRKLASIGVAISKGVCWHGFALNVDMDLGPFQLIRPCGLDVAVTSIAQHGPAPTVRTAASLVAATFASVFETPVECEPPLAPVAHPGIPSPLAAEN